MNMARMVCAMVMLTSSVLATHPILERLHNKEQARSLELLDAIVELADTQASSPLGRVLSLEENLGVQEINTEANVNVRAICHGKPASAGNEEDTRSHHVAHTTVHTIEVNGERCALHYFRDADLENVNAELTTMHGVPVHGYLLRAGVPTTTTTVANNGVTDGDADDDEEEDDSSGIPTTTCDFAMTSSPCSRESTDTKPNEAIIGGKRIVFEDREQRMRYCQRLAKLTLEMINPDSSVLQTPEVKSLMMKSDDPAVDAKLHRLATKDNAWTHGKKTLLAYIVKMPGDTTAPLTTSALETVLNKVGQYLKTNSYGEFEWEVTIVPEVIDVPNRKCTGGLKPARKKAKQLGYDSKNYDLDIIFFNYMDKCGWYGLASVAGKDNWINWDPSQSRNYVYGVVAHEVGHNLGLAHAANLGTYVRDAEEYGDSLDCMGDCGFGNSRSDGIGEHFNSAYKMQLGWIRDNENYVLVNGASRPESVRLFAMDEINGRGTDGDNKVALVIQTRKCKYLVETELMWDSETLCDGTFYGSMHVNSGVGTGRNNINNGITFVLMKDSKWKTTSRRIDLKPNTWTQGDGALKENGLNTSPPFQVSNALKVRVTITGTGTTGGVAYADVDIAYEQDCTKLKNAKGCNKIAVCQWKGRKCIENDGSTEAPTPAPPPLACGKIKKKKGCKKAAARCRWIKVRVGRMRRFRCRSKPE